VIKSGLGDVSSRSKPPNSPSWSRFNSLSKSPAAADLKAKQEAETKTAADKAAADKTRADIAAELKAKQYAEAAARLAATKKTIRQPSGRM